MRRSVRPTSAACRKHVARQLEPEQAKLYELIWTRTHREPDGIAELERTTVDIGAKAGARKRSISAPPVRSCASMVFSALYQEGRDDDEDDEVRPPAADVATATR